MLLILVMGESHNPEEIWKCDYNVNDLTNKALVLLIYIKC